ncbi:MAG: sulfatase [Spirochaetales bacterium]|nr:sulfatase [Spirochaetales bacterium]
MEKPNIILINCDDLGYGDLGCYGSLINKTPHIDKMAEQGLQLTDFYMASSVCSPSRAGMLTGCYPPRIGFGSFTEKEQMVLFPGDPEGLHPDEITIADQLKNAGYATKLIGKWHCGDQADFLPTKHGFDEYFGLPYSNDMGRQVDHPDWPPLPLLEGEEVVQQQPDQSGLTERYAYESLRFIREHSETPFFLYLAHMYVHVPLFVPRHFLERSENGGYGGAVECIDWVCGLLFKELEAQGIAENTLVIFTSDNGSRARGEGGSNAPLRGTKTTSWDGGFRVPCIMRWPGVIPEGVKCSELTTAMDFLPTISSLLNIEVSEDRIIDGKDISQLMKNPENEKSPHQTFAYYFANSLHAIRNDRWKLHFFRDGKGVKELYDLHNDSEENRNQYDNHPEIVEELEKAALVYRKEIGDSSTATRGTCTRPCGYKEGARPLTSYDSSHPYMVAMYDLADSQVLTG